MRFLLYFILMCALVLSSCSRSHSVVGGTRGVLRRAGTGLREVQIHVHRAGETEPIGFGVSTEGGTFALYQPGARGPLHLTPGDYAFTLESVGPEPIPLPRETSDLRRTPLRRTWTGSDTELELALP
jgi:hypothetical protein